MTGGNQGSYIVDEKGLENKFMMGNYFKTKFVFTTKFLENWQITEMLKVNANQPIKPITNKYRSIIFECSGKRYEDIFDTLLVFQITFSKKNKRTNIFMDTESCLSSARKHKIIHSTYKIPHQSFSYILRTRYQQGWEPVVI